MKLNEPYEDLLLNNAAVYEELKKDHDPFGVNPGVLDVSWG